MKALLFSFFALLCIFFSCQPSPKAQDGGEEDAQEEFVDTTPKATAIFWIDKHKEMLRISLNVDRVQYFKD